MTIERYLQHRRVFEAGLWAVFFGVQIVANSVVAWLDIERAGTDFAVWEPVVWECSSILVQAALIPVILAFDRRYPIQRPQVRRGLVAHAAFTVPWSILHVAAMVALRELAYWLAGGNYDFGDWPRQLFYEYLKDFRAYAGYLSIIYLYRFVLRRIQGEARFLEEGREENIAQAVTDRFLVKKLGREFLVRVTDIDWVEASGNYVNLHVGTKVYPLRETMTGIEAQLACAGFQRVHRSAIVNLDRVAEIAAFETGDGELRLTSDMRIPLSRRYRRELREKLG